MRSEGVEPSRSYEHRDLNPACLPFHHERNFLRLNFHLVYVRIYALTLPHWRFADFF